MRLFICIYKIYPIRMNGLPYVHEEAVIISQYPVVYYRTSSPLSSCSDNKRLTFDEVVIYYIIIYYTRLSLRLHLYAYNVAYARSSNS